MASATVPAESDDASRVPRRYTYEIAAVVGLIAALGLVFALDRSAQPELLTDPQAQAQAPSVELFEIPEMPPLPLPVDFITESMAALPPPLPPPPSLDDQSINVPTPPPPE